MNCQGKRWSIRVDEKFDHTTDRHIENRGELISDYNEEMSENLEINNMSNSTMFTSPGEIDEAGFVDIMSTLNESKNTETDRAKLRDDQKGFNIHEHQKSQR